jgi:transcriptional regulator with XRE-family HTH domain
MPKIDESAKQWQKDMAARVGSAVRRRRGDLGMTAAALADRTRELGYPISRVAIGKLENNHREGKFDLAELTVLAAALGIPPVMLIYPDLPHGSVEVLPGFERDATAALEWFVGDSPRLAFRMTERFGVNQQDVVDAAEPLLLSRELAYAETALEQADKERAARLDPGAGKPADSKEFTSWAVTATAQVDAACRLKDQTLRRMRALRLPMHSDYDDEVGQ